MGIQINGQTDIISASDGGLIVSGADFTGVSAGSTAAPSISPTGDSNTGIFFPAPDTVAIAEGGVEALRVDSSGRIGIGTDNPTKLIDMSGVHSGINTTGRFVMNPHGSGWDTGVTSGNIHHHYIDNFRLYTGQIGSGTLRWQIDSSGRVTKPYQPAFLAYRNSTLSVTGPAWQLISNGILTESYDVGSVYSTATNGRFVAPVAGRYMFYAGGYSVGNTNGERYAFGVKINNAGAPDFITGGNYCITDTPLAPYQIVLNLAANDYVELYYFSAISTTLGGSTHPLYWGGYLLG